MEPRNFWSKYVVDENGCWIWQGYVAPSGYARCYFPRFKRCMNSSRAAWIILYGDIPPSLFVCHHCDNPKCINPKHLFLGTVKDNSQDALKKGRLDAGLKIASSRVPRGDNHWSRRMIEKVHRGESQANSKLTNENVIEIRRLRESSGISHYKLAKMFGVSYVTIYKIVQRKTWRHI